MTVLRFRCRAAVSRWEPSTVQGLLSQGIPPGVRANPWIPQSTLKRAPWMQMTMQMRQARY